MTQFLQTLKEAAIFMLGAQVLLYLGPGKKYEKYGRMIVSLLVLAQLAQPLLQLFDKDRFESFASYLQAYEKQNEAFMDRLELLENDSDAPVWEGMVLSVEEQLADEAGQLGIRIERVTVLEGSLLIEIGVLESGTDSVSVEQIKAVFADKLRMDDEHLEVVVSG